MRLPNGTALGTKCSSDRGGEGEDLQVDDVIDK